MVFFGKTLKAITVKWVSLITWLQTQGLFDLTAYLNRCVLDKLPYICNIYFENLVTHLSTSIVEGNHRAFKSLFKKQSGAFKYNARMINLFCAIQVAVKDQPSAQHRSSMRLNVKWSRRAATVPGRDNSFARIKPVIDFCFGFTVQDQVSEHTMLPQVTQYGMKYLTHDSLQVVIGLLKKSYDNMQLLSILPTLCWPLKKIMY